MGAKKSTYAPADKIRIKAQLRSFARPDSWQATVQLLNTLVPYLMLWALMIALYDTSYFLVLVLALLAGLFLTRLFPFQHDCGHYSFFRSRRANNFWGTVIGLFTFTPFYNWRISHNLHHATTGNLDKRGHGDVWLMTTTEYAQSSRLRQLQYRVYRHPLVLFLIGPIFYFLVRRRFQDQLKPWMKKERYNLYLSNLLIILLYGSLSYLFGWQRILAVLLPVALVACSFGVWLFYVQHTYEEAYWQRNDSWDFFDAALMGSSYCVLPAWLEWFTASNSIHHIHHIEAGIPNYRLKECMAAMPHLKAYRSVELSDAFQLMRLTLWDETNQELVRFSV